MVLDNSIIVKIFACIEFWGYSDYIGGGILNICELETIRYPLAREGCVLVTNLYSLLKNSALHLHFVCLSVIPSLPC
jgi:hypothetical protein